MKDVNLEWSTEDPIALIAGKGNYAIMAGKGTGYRVRTSPESIALSPENAAALLAPLS